MDTQGALEILSGQRSGAGASVLRAMLWTASLPYSAAMRLRRGAYRWRVLPSHSVPVPVICVGNLTAGGTGKTPMVAWVIAELDRAGKTPAVLTRGYKGVDGTSDEAELLRAVCRVPVVLQPDRVTGARLAVQGGADVLVMDDGFQHRRLRRDLDIVLVDATNPFGYGHCLPRGLLREPPSALREAGAVVVTRCDQADPDDLGALLGRLNRLAPRASLHMSVHRPVRLQDLQGQTYELADLAGRRVLAFCGLGNPQGFFLAVESLGAQIVDREAYQDHMHYSADLLEELRQRARQADAEILVTTQKDAASFPQGIDMPELRELVVEIDVLTHREQLAAAIREAAR